MLFMLGVLAIVDKNFKISECLDMMSSWASLAVSALDSANSFSIFSNSPSLSNSFSSDSATASLAVTSSPLELTKTGSSYLFPMRSF